MNCNEDLQQITMYTEEWRWAACAPWLSGALLWLPYSANSVSGLRRALRGYWLGRTATTSQGLSATTSQGLSATTSLSLKARSESIARCDIASLVHSEFPACDRRSATLARRAVHSQAMAICETEQAHSSLATGTPSGQNSVRNERQARCREIHGADVHFIFMHTTFFLWFLRVRSHMTGRFCTASVSFSLSSSISAREWEISLGTGKIEGIHRTFSLSLLIQDINDTSARPSTNVECLSEEFVLAAFPRLLWSALDSPLHTSSLMAEYVRRRKRARSNCALLWYHL